jgi:Uma2 family endonuclease
MSILIDAQAESAEELVEADIPKGYELLHGQLVERNAGTESNWLAARIIVILGFFLESHPQGYVFASDTSYACFPNDPRHAPRPDVSFIRFGRLPGEQIPQGHCKIAPDLVVEVVSPNDKAERISEKVADFQSVGVPLIWVIYPSTRRVIVHRLPSSPTGRISELTESDSIKGEDVLPGFSHPIANLFRVPRPPGYVEK